MIERRHFKVRFDGDRTVRGIAVKYGDVATIYGGLERFETGAFQPMRDDITMNVQHSREKLIARTGAGLTLDDADDALRFRAELIDTQEGRDALKMVKGGLLRGASIEFLPVSERVEDRVRVISRADLFAVSLVDSPAYPQSHIEARNTGKGLSGNYKLGSIHTVSNKGTNRKRRVAEDAFDFNVPKLVNGALRTPDEYRKRDIIVNLGSSLSSVLGTTQSKTAEVFRDGTNLVVRIKAIPDTQAGKDLVALDAAGIPLYVRPRYLTDGVDNAITTTPEPGNTDVNIETVNNAVLLGIDLSTAGGTNGYSPVTITASQKRQSTRLHLLRRVIWL